MLERYARAADDTAKQNTPSSGDHLQSVGKRVSGGEKRGDNRVNIDVDSNERRYSINYDYNLHMKCE